MSFNRIVHGFVLLLLLSASLYGLARIQGGMNDIRREVQLTEDAPLENVDPVAAFVQVALGSFRGLLADYLFLRGSAMQEKGNYFELVQVASLLVKLQPDFTGAHAYLGWNMAYNVSVIFSSPKDRWRWVQRGLELLRDEALVYHPGDPKLYKELGWIYQHKIGQNLDDAHYYYKSQLAMQIIRILGNHRRFDWARLAATPKDQAALDVELGEASQQFYDILAKHDTTYARLDLEFRNVAGFPEALEPELEKAGLTEMLDFHFRARWLLDEAKLDPVWINQLIEQHGYLDFRLPEAHSLYWASQGQARADGGKDVDCGRMIFQSLKNAFIYGRLLYLDRGNFPFVAPNLEIADSVKQQYLEKIEQFPDNVGHKAGYENFLKDAVVLFYTGGQRERAEEFLKTLRSDHPTNIAYKAPIDLYALKELEQDITDKSLKQVTGMITQLLYQACAAAALDDHEHAVAIEHIARRVYNIYHKQLDRPRLRGRKGIQISFEEVKTEILKRCMASLPEDMAANLSPPADDSKIDLEDLKPGKRSKDLLETGTGGELPVQKH